MSGHVKGGCRRQRCSRSEFSFLCLSLVLLGGIFSTSLSLPTHVYVSGLLWRPYVCMCIVCKHKYVYIYIRYIIYLYIRYIIYCISVYMCLSVVWECVFDSDKKRETVQVQGNSWYQSVETLSLSLSLLFLSPVLYLSLSLLLSHFLSLSLSSLSMCLVLWFRKSPVVPYWTLLF